MLKGKLRGKKKVLKLFTLLQCLRRASLNDAFFQVLGLGWLGCQPLHCAHTHPSPVLETSVPRPLPNGHINFNKFETNL